MNVYDSLATLQNVDLLILGIANTAIVLLGVVIFLRDRKSITNKTFLLFSVIASTYATVNYFTYQSVHVTLVLWSLRFVIFSATWYSFLLFQLFYVFPKREQKFPKPYKFILVPIVIGVSILTLTPFVFSGLQTSVLGSVPVAVLGPGVLLFGVTSVFLVLGSFIILLRKTIKANASKKGQFQIVLVGALITYSFIIAFNLILPTAFNDTTLIPLAPIFTIPFIAFTAYAILRYRLLNVKVIATEILTFVLAVVALFEVLLARDAATIVFRVSVSILIVSFGIFLIRSVRKEVEQREELQELTGKLERANVQLKKLDKAKSEFVSIASHQLRTPLTAVKGYLSLILEGNYGQILEGFRKPLLNVYQSNERLIALVNDLLSLSRIESGKIKLEPAQTDVEEMIESVVDELNVKAKPKNIELAFEKPAEPLGKVLVDRDKLRNVVLNLIDNAIRYTKKGQVATTIEEREGKLLITVRDTGEGMNKEELAGLFESFSRGQTGRKLSAEGAGLGLYIAKQFVRMHKGKIWAESEGKGTGSAFFVEVPLVRANNG